MNFSQFFCFSILLTAIQLPLAGSEQSQFEREQASKNRSTVLNAAAELQQIVNQGDQQPSATNLALNPEKQSALTRLVSKKSNEREVQDLCKTYFILKKLPSELQAKIFDFAKDLQPRATFPLRAVPDSFGEYQGTLYSIAYNGETNLQIEGVNQSNILTYLTNNGNTVCARCLSTILCQHFGNMQTRAILSVVDQDVPYVITASNDHIVRIWNLSQAQDPNAQILPTSLNIGDANFPICMTSYKKNGSTYFVVGCTGRRLITFQSNPWRIVRSIELDPKVTADTYGLATFYRNNQLCFASCEATNEKLFLWNEEGKSIGSFDCNLFIQALATYSREGKDYVAIRLDNGVVVIYDPAINNLAPGILDVDRFFCHVAGISDGRIVYNGFEVGSTRPVAKIWGAVPGVFEQEKNLQDADAILNALQQNGVRAAGKIAGLPSALKKIVEGYLIEQEPEEPKNSGT